MTYLPSLIKKIDEFYGLATALTHLKKKAAPPTTWTMPDDPEEEMGEALPGDEGVGLYLEIKGAADKLSNERNDFKYEDIANELTLIAELYKKAIQIHGGYRTMQEYIKRAMANIDMMIDESDGFIGEDVREISDDILEDVSGDLRARAKSSVINQMDEPTALAELRTIKNQFNSEEARQEMAQQKSVYEKGKPGAETGHGISARPVPKTPEKYAQEIARLEGDKSPDSIELVRIINQIVAQMASVQELKDKLAVAPDEATEKELGEAQTQLDLLRKARQVLKRKLNENFLSREKSDLQHALSTAKPAYRAWLEEKINLLNLRLDPKLVGKREKIQKTEDLISSMGQLDPHGDFIPLGTPEQHQARRDAIAAAKQPVQKEVYDAVQSKERAKEHGKLTPQELEIMRKLDNALNTGKITKQQYDALRWEALSKARGRVADIIPREKGRRGGGTKGAPINAFDHELATFTGLVQKFSDKVNTAANTARQNVTQEVTSAGKVHNALKPYVELLSKAIQKKDNKAKYEAVRALKQAIVEWSSREPALKILEKSARLLPYFNKYKEDLKKIGDWKTGEDWNLNDAQKTFIALVIRDAKRLSGIYGRFYQKPGQPELFYDAALKQLEIVLQRLESETGVTGAPDVQ